MKPLATRGYVVAALAALGIAASAGVASAAVGGTATRTSETMACASQGYGQQLTQSNDGRVSGCLRLGPLPPGVRTIVLQQYLGFGVLRPRKRLPRPAPPPHEPSVALSLSPASGGPGTVVRVRGRLARPLPRRTVASDFPGLCWDGCTDGIPYVAATVHWTSERSFWARVVVPAAPWVQSGPVRIVPLVSGSYPIAITCVRPERGCAAVTERSAPFRLTVRRAVKWCRTQSSCASLRVHPQAARPAETVRLTGLAPLTEIAGPGQQALLAPQTLPGRRLGPQVRLSRDQVVFGRAALRVLAPLSFAALRGTAPLAEVHAGLAQVNADPGAPSTVAWCSGPTIVLQTPSGSTTVSTAAARTEIQKMGLSPGEGSLAASCSGVAPIDGSGQTMTALAAAFAVAPSPGGPPFYDVALQTSDGGANWSPVPVPAGALAASFGAFRYDGTALVAIYSAAHVTRRDPYPVLDPGRVLTEISSGDGSGWKAAPLGCPGAGPCLTLAPFVPGNCAMNGSQQALLRSTDSGVRWSSLTFPSAVQACDTAELAATPAGLLVVDSLSQYPVMRTTDGGSVWSDVGLPRLHGGPGQLQVGFGQGGLTLLPDGSLLFAGGSYPWELLRPGARAWCAVTTPARAAQRSGAQAPVAAIGAALWWLTFPMPSAGPGSAIPTAHSLALSSLAC